MYQSRHARHAFILSVLALMLCFCMLIGTTYAWFTDSVTSDKNEIVAGNLDVELEYYKDGGWTTVEGASDIFDPNALWEPGRTEVVYLKASNAGTLAFKYVLSINLNGETAATNVKNETFKLSDYLMFDIVADVKPGDFADRAAAIAATTDAKTLQESLIGNINDDGLVRGELEPVGEGNVSEKYVAVVLWMPTEVENDANTKPGTAAPTLDLGVSIAATQLNDEDEKDSFDDEGYDAGATLPNFGTGSYVILGTESSYPIEVRGTENQKLGSFEVPADAVEDGAASIEGTIEEVPARTGNFTVEAGETLKSYEVEVTNIVEGNTTKIKVYIRIAEAGTYIAKEDIKIYHDGDPVADEDFISYDSNTGILSFYTTSFSPFDIIFKESEAPEVPETPVSPEVDSSVVGNNPTTPIPEDNEAGTLPMAGVTNVDQHENTDIAWGKYGQWSPDYTVDENPQLEAAYQFVAPEGASESVYKDWYCDFYVSLDRDLGENQIFLGGNYGSFGWIGFHNGALTLPANTEIALLGSVTSNPWTYEAVANSVGTFICGVGDVNDALAGATFTVHLRLTNPNDTTEFYNVNTVTYTFPAAQ